MCSMANITLAVILLILGTACSWVLSHSHGKHGIHDDGMMANQDHLKQHLNQDYGIDKDPSEMSKSELEFYEFKAHDFDKNSKLDGLEMLKAMTHYDFIDVNSLTPEERRTMTAHEIDDRRKRLIEEKYESMEKEIDHIMEQHDLDKDGYVDYAEYLMARWESEDK